jgi:hypothetical protein
MQDRIVEGEDVIFLSLRNEQLLHFTQFVRSRPYGGSAAGAIVVPHESDSGAPSPHKPPARPGAPGRCGINGATEESLHSNGISANVVAELDRIGWATSTTTPVKAGAKTIEVRRYKITDAGSKELQASKSFR